MKLSAEHMMTLDEASAFDVGYSYAFMARVMGGW